MKQVGSSICMLEHQKHSFTGVCAKIENKEHRKQHCMIEASSKLSPLSLNHWIMMLHILPRK